MYLIAFSSHPLWMPVPCHLKNNEVCIVPQGLSTDRNSLGTLTWINVYVHNLLCIHNLMQYYLDIYTMY